jgi:hypothetical protein
MTTEESSQLRETVDTPGWQLILSYLEAQDLKVTNAIKKDLVNMKWEEHPKWFAYYSGQAALIVGLKKYIAQGLAKPDMLAKIKAFKPKSPLDL